MKRFFANLWPRAAVRSLERERATLTTALSAATKKVVELQSKLDEAHATKCPTCETLKQTVNFLVFAAGSRHPMFQDSGPTLPAPKYTEAPAPIAGKRRAGAVVNGMNREYIEKFMAEEAQMRERLESDSEQLTGEPQ